MSEILSKESHWWSLKSANIFSHFLKELLEFILNNTNHLRFDFEEIDPIRFTCSRQSLLIGGSNLLICISTNAWSIYSLSRPVFLPRPHRVKPTSCGWSTSRNR